MSNKVSLQYSLASSFRDMLGRLCVLVTTLASFVICSSSVMKQVTEIGGSWPFLQKEKPFQHDIYV